MSRFPLFDSLDDALRDAGRLPPDALGQRFYTFRIVLADEDPLGHGLISRLVDQGWQIQGGPLVIEGVEKTARHLLVSMLLAEPRPLEVRGHFNLGGEIRAEGQIDGRTR